MSTACSRDSPRSGSIRAGGYSFRTPRSIPRSVAAGSPSSWWPARWRMSRSAARPSSPTAPSSPRTSARTRCRASTSSGRRARIRSEAPPMTRLDTDDAVVIEESEECDGPRALLLESREVPLGGVRAMHVSRALPQRNLPLVGAWCFLDRFGPQVTRMRVEPHPHIGLQTVTWPFVGEVRHRDTLGSDVVVRRGALNLMTSGAGIAHSEYSVGEEAAPLDALQLWVALPEHRRHGARAFERHDDLPIVD